MDVKFGTIFGILRIFSEPSTNSDLTEFASLLLFTVFHGFTLLDRTHISKIFTKWCAKGRAEKIENTQTSRRAPMLLLEFEAELLPFR